MPVAVNVVVAERRASEREQFGDRGPDALDRNMEQRDRMHEFVGKLLATGAVRQQPVLPVLDSPGPAGESVADQRQ